MVIQKFLYVKWVKIVKTLNSDILLVEGNHLKWQIIIILAWFTDFTLYV